MATKLVTVQLKVRIPEGDPAGFAAHDVKCALERAIKSWKGLPKAPSWAVRLEDAIETVRVFEGLICPACENSIIPNPEVGRQDSTEEAGRE